MLKIYIARHGQDKDNVRGILNGHRDEPLTILGQNQAKDLAEKIKEAGIKFDKIYSSPLKRTFSNRRDHSGNFIFRKTGNISRIN